MKRRPLITILLALSCIVSAVMLVATPSHKAIDYSAAENLDSLIASALSQEPSIGANFRRYDIEVDSNFTRTVYRVPVHPTFSKTMFHYTLHQTLSKLKIESPAKVLFPERDMNIYIYDNGTIRSTIRLITTEPKQESE
ncbi:MAG: hypothetical protein ABJ387_10055 [Balneola sp.]